MGGKLIKGTMDMRTIVLLFVLMILISASLPRVTSGRLLAVDFVDYEVEQILLDCGLDPEDMESSITDSREANCRSKFYISRGNWEAFSPPSPALKHTLLDCLSKHNILFQVSSEDDPRNRYSEYVASLTMSRRHLADKPKIGLSPTSSPSPSSFLAPSPSPSPSPSPTPGPEVQTPSYGPSPSYNHDLHSHSPSPTPVGASPQISGKPSSEKGVMWPSEDNNGSKKKIVITAVLVTVGATVIASFLICCCCGCFRKATGSVNGQKDGRPLLNQNMSDFSGSSYNSGLGYSVQNHKIGPSSGKTGSSLNGHVVALNGSGESLATVSTELSNASNNAVGTISPSLSPLKPPPGRDMGALPPKPKPAPPPPAPPPPLAKVKPSPPPPPPSKAVTPPRPAQASSSYSKVSRPSPLGLNHSGNADEDDNAPKAKLKPLFWDKVSTNPEKSMVWNEIKSGSFQFNEEMIETLFGYRSDDKRKADGKKNLMLNDPSQYIQLLDAKKSQNLAISLKAMSIKTDEVSDALMEGNELPPELLQTLLRMAPTTDEELKLRLYNGDPSLLGPGEQFLKSVMDIPFAFKRIDALLFITSLPEEVASIKESFASLEVACKELRSSRLFLKLLEAVLKLGNRMNDGTFRGGAQAFKLDTLLKLSDVKGADGKTTLLHFVVQEIIRSEGARIVRIAKESSNDQSDDSFQDSEDQYQTLGLKIVSSLSTELDNVKKAAGLDADALTNNVASLGDKLVKTKEFLNTDMRSTEEDSGFHRLLKSFVEHAEVDITFLLDEEKRITALVKSTTDYFHGNLGRDEGLRLFVIVRDFLGMIDKACKEVKESEKKIVKVPRNRDNTILTPILEPRQHLFPTIRGRRVDSSCSDDDES